MVLTKTPICNFGEKPHSFSLKGVDDKIYKLEDCLGDKGTVIMFICNHCPYVKAIIKNIVDDSNNLRNLGVNSIAIMSNDTKNYPDDSFDKMKDFAKDNKFNFPYVIDETQEIAKKFGAVCTPDFFGYNSNNELQYRGRMRELKELKPVSDDESDLFKAMKLIAQTGKGPKNQIPSMGCNIKWFN
jgi:peroxiredoxin